ncbi:MAG: TVP38/TMEM64 family protein [Pseudomonadota bacterium]
MARQPSIVHVIVISILFVALVTALLLYFDVHEDVLRFFDWLDAQGIRGPLLFIVFMVLVVVLLLPGVMFTTGAGFVFGVVEGTICVVVGTTLGAALAFLIARHLFGDRASQFVMRHARLRLVSEEFTPQGWKIVLLTRLVPFFPFKLSNYFFGLTQFSLRGFMGGTIVGIIPLSLHNVWLGSIAADISLEGARNAERSPVEWGLYGAGFLVTIGLVIYLNRLARRALARYTEENAAGDM